MRLVKDRWVFWRLSSQKCLGLLLVKQKVPKQDVLSTYNALAFCGPAGQIYWFFPTGLETIDVGMLLLLVIFIPWGGGRVLHIAQAGLRLMTLLTTCSD